MCGSVLLIVGKVTKKQEKCKKKTAINGYFGQKGMAKLVKSVHFFVS